MRRPIKMTFSPPTLPLNETRHPRNSGQNGSPAVPRIVRCQPVHRWRSCRCGHYSTERLDELIKAGTINAGQYPTVARVGIGLFTRADAGAPDVPPVAAFKRALLGADRLGFSNVAGGNDFATVLERLGLADAVNDRVVRANPSEVIARIVEGKGKDIGVISMTLVLADRREFAAAGAE
jgi:hypothetical protein